MKLVVLASGRGTNFAAIADGVRDGAIPRTEILALVSNKPSAPALQLARQRGIPTHVIDSKAYRVNGTFQRNDYERELRALLQTLNPDYICLAGYMLLLGEELVRDWPNRIINIHPSLLPSFRGLRAQSQAIEAGVHWTGCTVHLVTEALDDGPILAQEVIEITPNDTEESLSSRLLVLEHKTYLGVLKNLATQRMQIKGKRILWSR